jgi:excisionase family DNA binding protein
VKGVGMSRRVVQDKELMALVQDAVTDAFDRERAIRKEYEKSRQRAAAAKYGKSLAVGRAKPKEGYTTPREVAKFLAVSKITVYRLMTAQKLVAVSIGGQKRILWAEVYDFCRRNIVGADRN